jgi:hypothetical protein
VTTDDGDAILRSGGDLFVVQADVGDVLSLTSTGGDVTLFDGTSGYDTLISAAGDVMLVSAVTTDIGATAPTSTANIIVTAGGDVDIGTLNSAENISITAASISGLDSQITATLAVTLTTTGNMVFGSLDANTLFADAGGSIRFGDIVTTSFTNLSADTGIQGGRVESEDDSVSAFTSGGNIQITNSIAGQGVSLFASTGDVTAEFIEAGSGGIGVFAGGNAGVDNANSGAGLSVTAGGSAFIGTTTSVDRAECQPEQRDCQWFDPAVRRRQCHARTAQRDWRGRDRCLERRRVPSPRCTGEQHPGG